MKYHTLRSWSPDIDPSTIPDEVLASERGRRNNQRRIDAGAVSGPAKGKPWTPARREAQLKLQQTRARLQKQWLDQHERKKRTKGETSIE